MRIFTQPLRAFVQPRKMRAGKSLTLLIGPGLTLKIWIWNFLDNKILKNKAYTFISSLQNPTKDLKLTCNRFHECLSEDSPWTDSDSDTCAIYEKYGQLIE